MIGERAFNLWDRFWKFDSLGNLAVSFFLICVVSGIFLAVPYDVAEPESSISLMLISGSAASFVRNLHYWSAQLFFVFSILHLWEHLVRKSE